MNSESQSTQASKSTLKRAHRANRNRPVLVTNGEGSDLTTEQESPAVSAETNRSAVALAVEESPIGTEKRRRGPRFFANGERAESTTNQSVDPITARIKRALGGKSVSTEPSEVEATKPATRAQKANVVPARPTSGFKTRYMWGMVIYLLAADLLGVYVTNLMQANHLDSTLFVYGSFKVTSSTVVFLGLLVVILVVMARLDYLPRSLSGMFGGAAGGKGSPGSTKGKDAPTFESKASQPTMKQGVQGEHDSLYKEYRENQRYFQKRDRKR